MSKWRVCLEAKGKWWYCQNAECPNDHRLYNHFIGVGPVVGKWEGVKHKSHKGGAHA